MTTEQTPSPPVKKPTPRKKPTTKPAAKKPARKPATKKNAIPKEIPTLGRPSSYTEEMADKICALLVQGMSCNKISQLDGFPAKSVIYWWLSQHQTFLDKYTQALEIRSLTFLDEMADIADDGSNDYYEKKGKNGETFMAFDSEHVQRSRLRVDTRIKLLEKLQPRKYGAKVDMNHGVQTDNPIMQLLSLSKGTKLAAVSDDDQE